MAREQRMNGLRVVVGGDLSNDRMQNPFVPPEHWHDCSLGIDPNLRYTIKEAREFEDQAFLTYGVKNKIGLLASDSAWTHFSYEGESLRADTESVSTENHSFILGSNRYIEHIVALRGGLGIDLRVSSTHNNLPCSSAGLRPVLEQLKGNLSTTGANIAVTLREPLSILFPDRGSSIRFEPDDGNCQLIVEHQFDHTNSALGRQGIVAELTPELFSFIASARTTAYGIRSALVRTLNLFSGQNTWAKNLYESVVVVGRREILNPKKAFDCEGVNRESLAHEVVDKVALLGLLPWRFVGRIISDRTSHREDLVASQLLDQLLKQSGLYQSPGSFSEKERLPIVVTVSDLMKQGPILDTVQSHISDWISDRVDPDSNFALANPSVQHDQQGIQIIIGKLNKDGYNGLFLYEENCVKGHVFYQKQEDCLGMFSLWTVDSSDHYLLPKLMRSFLEHAQTSGVNYVQFGINGHSGFGSFLETLKLRQHVYGVQVLDNGIVRVNDEALVAASAEISPSVQLGKFVTIGEGVKIKAGVVIDDYVTIGAGTSIEPYCHINAYTEIGEDNQIGTFCVIGGKPQQRGDKGLRTKVIIGNRNEISSHVTIDRGTSQNKVTKVGDCNVIMAGVHIGHDAVIGNGNTFVNQVKIAGHVRIDGQCYVSTEAKFAPYVRIGRGAMITEQAAVTGDVPPFSRAGLARSGRRAIVLGVNTIGMKVLGYDAQSIADIKRLQSAFYGKEKMTVTRMKEEFSGEVVDIFINFLDEQSGRILPSILSMRQNK